MCDALGVEAQLVASKTTENQYHWRYESERYFMPLSVRRALGIFDGSGSVLSELGEDKPITVGDQNFHCLANLNDGSELGPNDIGAILEPMINGGSGTPWKKIDVTD